MAKMSCIRKKKHYICCQNINRKENEFQKPTNDLQRLPYLGDN